MSDYTLKPFEKADLYRIETRHHEDLEYATMGYNLELFAESFIHGPGFTLLYKGTIVGCAGVTVLWKGVGEGWFRGSPLIYEHRSKVILASIEGFKMIRESGFHRIQSIIVADHHAAVRYAEKLGFEFEGVMRKYGPDKSDCLRYAYISEDK